jgi:hypothetical protein
MSLYKRIKNENEFNSSAPRDIIYREEQAYRRLSYRDVDPFESSLSIEDFREALRRMNDDDYISD